MQKRETPDSRPPEVGISVPRLACEQQTYFRSSLLSLRRKEGEKRQPEILLLFAGYPKVCIHSDIFH